MNYNLLSKLSHVFVRHEMASRYLVQLCWLLWAVVLGLNLFGPEGMVPKWLGGVVYLGCGAVFLTKALVDRQPRAGRDDLR